MPYDMVPAKTQGEWGVNFLLYSTPGAGKTTLAASAVRSLEHGAPVLVVDAEGGARVLSDMDNITVIPIKDIDAQGRPGYGWERILEVCADLIKRDPKVRDYKTIVFDNLSEYIHVCLRHVMRTYPRNIDIKDRPDQNDWGKMTLEILLFVRRMRDFARNNQVNVVFIAWETPEKNSMGQTVGNRLMVNPALAKSLPGIVDAVGFLSVVDDKTEQRELTFQASSRTDAKFRRSGTEAASKIPTVMRWTLKEDCPLNHIIETLRTNADFPVAKYNLRAANAQSENKKEVS